MPDSSASSHPGVPTATVFRYTRPILTRSKDVVSLARSDIMFGAIQVLREGGENNLHSHAQLDGFWFVLSGRVRFYTTDDEFVAELGPLEGILVPRTYPYWFESVGEGEAEILQVEASAKLVSHDRDFEDRIDHAPRRGLLAELDAEASAAPGEVSEDG